MEKRKHPYLWGCIYGIFLTAYAVFTLLDAFVIPRNIVYVERMQQDQQKFVTEPLDNENLWTDSETEVLSQPIVTETGYESSKFSIQITTLHEYDTEIYVADIKLYDPSCLRTGLAEGILGRNVSEPTSVIAENCQAILAINGDFYGFRDSGYVMRNGYLYRTEGRPGYDDESLVIYGDGSAEIIKESETEAQELADSDAVQIFSFGPGLLQDGEITVDENSEVERAMRSNPRTAFGVIEPLHYLFVVSDGRTKESAGLTLFELAQVMQEQGCELAYNLDGGGSSTMWFMGKVINHPTSGHRSGERSVSDIVYVGE